MGETTGLPRNTASIGIVGLAAVLFVPYGVAGPGFLIDDWFTLNNGAFDGWWMSAGADQWRARPVAAAIYALTFGVIGEQPLVHYVLAVIVVTAIAVTLHRLASRHLPPLAAFNFAALWLLIPNHTSLEMWPSALNIGVALLLTCWGVGLLTSREQSLGRDVLSAVLLGAALLSYEAIGPAAVGAVALVAALRRGSRRWHAIVPSALSLGTAGSWMLLNWHPDKKGLDASLDLSATIVGHFGTTVAGDVRFAEVLLTIAVLGASVIALWQVRSGLWPNRLTWVQPTLGIGWALIVLGTLPFARYFYAPLGLGDRVTVVSGVGSALVITATLGLLAQRWTIAVVALVVLVVPAFVAQRWSLTSDYATAVEDSRRIRAAVAERWPRPPEEPIVLGPSPIVRRNIVAFYDVGSSIQLLYGTRRAEAWMAFDEADFFATPLERRLDIRRWSKLDDGRLEVP